jgi:hypothetical protein
MSPAGSCFSSESAPRPFYLFRLLPTARPFPVIIQLGCSVFKYINPTNPPPVFSFQAPATHTEIAVFSLVLRVAVPTLVAAFYSQQATSWAAMEIQSQLPFQIPIDILRSLLILKPIFRSICN